jgi:hypothetical protein
VSVFPGLYGILARNQLLAGPAGVVPELLLLPRLARALSRRLQDQGDYLPVKARNDASGVNCLHGQRALEAGARACRARTARGEGVFGVA